MKRNPFLVMTLLSSFILLESCNPEEEPEGCFNSKCESWAYTIVDSSNCSLMDTMGSLIHPDSIRIKYQNGKRIPHSTFYQDWNDWWTFDFLYQDALERCDLYNTDSTFTMRFYIYLGNQDTDTLDIRIAPCRDHDTMLYNGLETNVFNPSSSLDLICGRNPNSTSSFLLRKNNF